MTDKVNIFGTAKRTVGFRNGGAKLEVVNLTKMFAEHGLDMNADMGGFPFPGQNEK